MKGTQTHRGMLHQKLDARHWRYNALLKTCQMHVPSHRGTPCVDTRDTRTSLSRAHKIDALASRKSMLPLKIDTLLLMP